MDGRKDDNGKARFDLVPPSALEQIVQVLNFGAVRYADDNWQKVPQLEARYYAALQRHLTAWRKGEMYDSDSGLPHLAHAGCCLLFLLSNQIGFDRSLTRQEQLDADVDELLPLDARAEMFYLSARKSRPDFSREKARALLSRILEERTGPMVTAIIDHATGADLVTGDPKAPTPTGPTATAPATGAAGVGPIG